MAVYTKKYNGSSWVTAPVKRWNGSSWVDATVNKWNGSAWEQLYPDVYVSRSQTLSSSAANMNTYRSKWDNDKVAKQGVYSSYKAAHGYLAINAGSITGSGNISSVSSAKFSGTRDGSGNYNNNQTVRFHRSNIAPTSSSPVGTVTGQFTATTGKPGSGGAMSNRTITMGSEGLNWMNKVSSKPYLYIYSSATADYAGIKGTFSITMSYTYKSKMLLFSEADAEPLLMSKHEYKQRTGKDPYYSIIAYEGEEKMSLQEILDRRERGIVEDISFGDIDPCYEAHPWTREYEVKYNDETKTCTARVEVFDMRMENEVQCSLDGIEWHTMYQTNPKNQYHELELPKDFNRYSNFVYVRVLDKKREVVEAEFTIEPIIFLPNQTSGLILPGNIDLEAVLPPIESFRV